MRGLPLSRLAASLLAAATMAVVMTASAPGHSAGKESSAVTADGGTDCDKDTEAKSGCDETMSSSEPANEEMPSAAENTGDAGYWTPERMRSAVPLPTPKISDEEYQRLFGKDGTKKKTE